MGFDGFWIGFAADHEGGNIDGAMIRVGDWIVAAGQRGDIVFIDNVSVHKVDGIEEAD